MFVPICAKGLDLYKEIVLTFNMEKNDSEVLQDAVDGTLSEFFDEYIILGRKAGRKQRMVVASVTPGNKEMKAIYKKVIDWAYKKDENMGET